MIVSRAPLRLPLGGGGTDVPSYYERYGGFFVSAAVDKYVYVNLNRPTADDLIRVKYSRSEEVRLRQEIQHDLVREALLELDIPNNIEIASMADVPAGTGMGSSGSYLVALLVALHALKRDHQPVWALAEEACCIEMLRAGHPVGKQDQYVAAWGGLNCYEVQPAGEVTVTPLKVPRYALEDLARHTVLYYTGKTRSADAILGQQTAATLAGDRAVVDSLHRTKQFGYEVKDALEAGDLVRFGMLLHRHWLNKKERSASISDERLDDLYQRGLDAGALGGKIIGAGGGGFLMLLAPEQANRAVREAMAAKGLRYMPFAFDLEGAKVLLNL